MNLIERSNSPTILEINKDLQPVKYSLAEVLPIEIISKIASYELGIEFRLKRTCSNLKNLRCNTKLDIKFIKQFLLQYAKEGKNTSNFLGAEYYENQFQLLKNRINPVDLAFELDCFGGLELNIDQEVNWIRKIADLIQSIPSCNKLTLDSIDMPNHFTVFADLGKLPNCIYSQFAFKFDQILDQEYWENDEKDVFGEFWQLLSQSSIEHTEAYFQHFSYYSETHLPFIKAYLTSDSYKSLTLIMKNDVDYPGFELDLEHLLANDLKGEFLKTNHMVCARTEFKWQTADIRPYVLGEPFNPDQEDILHSIKIEKIEKTKRKGEPLENKANKKHKTS